MSAFLIFVVMPLTFILGYFIGQEHYILVSTLVLLYTLLPFFMVFERRRPMAREIVLIAMMSAITVFCQIILHVSIPVQIGTAIIIISGISLGPEAGFLIGALSRFVINFYLGQGSWTPWQMFSWGVLGFLAGLAFNKIDLKSKTMEQKNKRQFQAVFGPVICIIVSIVAAWVSYMFFPGADKTFFGWRLYAFGLLGLILGVLFQRKRLPADNVTITLYTFFTTFIIYGGIMNFCSMVTSIGYAGAADVGLGTLRALYISGTPYDLMHAVTAALCTYLFGDTLITKLERVKIKYGIYR
ncbi:MAG: ECF transporter S component [Ruminococcaceae bacterium]|nr:ECF transporter S component [Oscillospiraceae bacterium]